MAEFAYNNTKNANIGYKPSKLNCRYYPRVFYKKDFYLHLKSRIIKKLSSKLQELITVYQQNFYHL